MKPFLSLVLAVFLANTAAAQQQLSPAEVKSLLQEIRQKRAAAPQVQADFREEKTMKLMNKPVVSSGKVWFQAPNKFRREVRGSSPSVTVSDGQTLWIHYPKFQSAEQYTLGKRSPLDAGIAAITASLNLEGVENSYNITAVREGNGYVLTLLPRSGATKKLLQQFTIRLNQGLQVERTEMLQPNGDRIVTTYSNESRAAIDPGTFQFTPPPGTKVTTPLGR
jgi:outer membrane lipoprotein carrier protein